MASNMPQHLAAPLTVKYKIPVQHHPFEIIVTKTHLSLDGKTRLVDQQVTNQMIVPLQCQELTATTMLHNTFVDRGQDWVEFLSGHEVERRKLEAFAAAALAVPYAELVYRGKKDLSGANARKVWVFFLVPHRFLDATRESARRLPGFLSFSEVLTEGGFMERGLQSGASSSRDLVVKYEA